MSRFKVLNFLSLFYFLLSFFSNISIASSSSPIPIIKTPGMFSSPHGKCEASLTVNKMGGFLDLSIYKKPDKRSKVVADVTGIAWFKDEQLIYTVSPIYGKPGVYVFNCQSMSNKKVLGPKNTDKSYPKGSDYFELQGVSMGPDVIIYFYYAPDVDAVDFKNFRTSGSLYKVGLDGNTFRKAK